MRSIILLSVMLFVGSAYPDVKSETEIIKLLAWVWAIAVGMDIVEFFKKL